MARMNRRQLELDRQDLRIIEADERRQRLLDMTAEEAEPEILSMSDAEVEAMLADFGEEAQR